MSRSDGRPGVGVGQSVGAEDADVLPVGCGCQELPMAVRFEAAGFGGLKFGAGVVHGAPFYFFFPGRTFPAKV